MSDACAIPTAPRVPRAHTGTSRRIRVSNGPFSNPRPEPLASSRDELPIRRRSEFRVTRRHLRTRSLVRPSLGVHVRVCARRHQRQPDLHRLLNAARIHALAFASAACCTCPSGPQQLHQKGWVVRAKFQHDGAAAAIRSAVRRGRGRADRTRRDPTRRHSDRSRRGGDGVVLCQPQAARQPLRGADPAGLPRAFRLGPVRMNGRSARSGSVPGATVVADRASRRGGRDRCGLPPTLDRPGG